MKKLNFSLYKGVLYLLSILFCLSLVFFTESETFAYSAKKDVNSSGHAWIIKKAVEHLKDKEIGKVWPLDDYLERMVTGAWFADHTGTLMCDFTFGEYDCDTIHHYGFPGDIETELAFSIGNNGDFASAYYTKALFDQAIPFWPKGETPDLNNLPYLYGGYVKLLFDYITFGGNNLGNTYVGGLPYCELWVHKQLFEKYFEEYYEELSYLYPPETLIPEENKVYEMAQSMALGRADQELNENPYCPKWPYYITFDDESVPLLERYKSAEESIENALFYLGWALHMMQDITVPQNAVNNGDLASENFEGRVQELMESKLLDHLPIDENNGDNYKLCGNSCDTDFPNKIRAALENVDDVEEIVTRLLKLTIVHFYGSLEGPFEFYNLTDNDGQKEQIIDAAVLFTAGLIERFFRQFMVDSDYLEENDSYSQAKIVEPGIYNNLTIEAGDPTDEDWYKIQVDEDFSDIIIDIFYDKSSVDLTSHVKFLNSNYFAVPEETSFGIRIEMKDILAGDYFLHILLTDQAFHGSHYNMSIILDKGSLPPDEYEDNDIINTAKMFFYGCHFDLNIDKAGDDDYYYVNVTPDDRITANIEFYPEQGNLQLFLDSVEATDTRLTIDNTKRIYISRCASNEKSIIRIAGSRNYYDMCVAIDYNDPSCGNEPEPSIGTDFCFESEIALDNVHIISFSNTGTSMDYFLPPDTDGDVGGNISAGKSCMALSPYGDEKNLNQYVLIATNEEENSLIISASAVDLTGVDFNTEFWLYFSSTELGIINDLSDGIFDSIDVRAEFYTAGNPQGILLTPLGSSATLYSFSSGTKIGWVNSEAAEIDTDLDNIPDSIDNCPLISNLDQEDSDGDGQGDVCDDDLDGDGVKNDRDNCPFTANFSQTDFDGDGQGDACDNDIDDDGVPNDADDFEWTPVGEVVNHKGLSIYNLCPCNGPIDTTVLWRNKGKYVSCVAKTAESFVEEGLITEAEKDKIVSEAAQSDCGRKK
jgi:hypothetical protein